MRADQGAVLSIGPCIIRHSSGSFLRDLRDGRLNSSREVFKKKPLRAAVFIGARKFKWLACFGSRLNVLVRNDVFGSRIPLLSYSAGLA